MLWSSALSRTDVNLLGPVSQRGPRPLVKWQAGVRGKPAPIRVITLKDRTICSYLRNEADIQLID